MTPSLWKIEKHNFRGGPFLVDTIFAPLDTMIQLPHPKNILKEVKMSKKNLDQMLTYDLYLMNPQSGPHVHSTASVYIYIYLPDSCFLYHFWGFRKAFFVPSFFENGISIAAISTMKVRNCIHAELFSVARFGCKKWPR